MFLSLYIRWLTDGTSDLCGSQILNCCCILLSHRFSYFYILQKIELGQISTFLSLYLFNFRKIQFDMGISHLQFLKMLVLCMLSYIIWSFDNQIWFQSISCAVSWFWKCPTQVNVHCFIMCLTQSWTALGLYKRDLHKVYQTDLHKVCLDIITIVQLNF